MPANDPLGEAKWWNLPVVNATQNRYTRFMETPYGELKSSFNNFSDNFTKHIENALKSVYLTETENDRF